jgi:hypothetical protein
VKAPQLRGPSEKDIARFVESGAGKDRTATVAAEEPQARLPVYLPKTLHRRFKTACFMREVSMAEEVRAFIEKRTAELEAGR